MFYTAFPRKEEEEDSDEDGEDWLMFFNRLDNDDLYNLNQVEFEPMVKKKDVAA